MGWLGNLLGGIAPIVGTVLGGPLGGAIGGLVGGAIGGGSAPTPIPQAMPGGGGSMIYGGVRPQLSSGGAKGGSVTSLPYLPASDSGAASDAGNPGVTSSTASGPGGLVCQGRESLNPTPHTKAGKPRKWRATKNGGCTWHKKPSINAMNPHAARRAIHRITKARRLLHHIERALPHVRVHHATSSRRK